MQGSRVNWDLLVTSACLMHQEILRERERIAEKEKKGLEKRKTRNGGHSLACESDFE